MKRLQVTLSDEVYASLKREAELQHVTVSEFVRRGIDRQIDSCLREPNRTPARTPVDLGTPLIPIENWREAANHTRGGPVPDGSARRPASPVGSPTQATVELGGAELDMDDSTVAWCFGLAGRV